MKVGVIGHGFVGRSVSNFYRTTLIYDKFKPSVPLEKVVKEAKVIFVCVPTNGTRSGYDYRPLKEVIKLLDENNCRVPIIIKSTIQPGTTDCLQNDYPNLDIYFSPEFLDQATAENDFAHPANPPCILLGIPKGKNTNTKGWSGHLFKDFGVPLIMTSAITAETFKLATNSYYTTRVVFANQVYDFCQTIGADYELVASLWGQISRLGTHGYRIVHQGGRGAGGYCLPKDLHAFISSALKLKLKFPFLRSVEKINLGLLNESGKLRKNQK